MSLTDVFRRIVSILNQANIPYMLTGSFAAVYYGAPRSTQDIDFVIAATPEQLRTFDLSLPKQEYYFDLDAALEAEKRESLFNVIDKTAGWKIDFIMQKSRPFSEQEFHRRKEIDFQGVSLLVATAEDVILSKLEWAKLAQSQRQLEDVARLLNMRRDALDRKYLEKWIDDLGLDQEWKAAGRILGSE